MSQMHPIHTFQPYFNKIHSNITFLFTPNSNDTALGYGLDDRGFGSRRELRIFLFTIASRLALGTTQPPIQWVIRAFSLEVKQPGREADHSFPSSAEVKECVDLYFNSPIRLHGVVFSKKKKHRNQWSLPFRFSNQKIICISHLLCVLHASLCSNII
jgi:hypothetical protein